MDTIVIIFQCALGLSLLLLAASTVYGRWRKLLAVILPTGRLAQAVAASVFLLAAIALLVGAAIPFATFFGACLGLLSSLVLATRALHTRQALAWTVPLAIAGASIGIAAAQPLGLKVLALPKAADLPFVAVPARVVKTYDEGLWFEGIAAASDGTLYLSGNRGLNFSRSDYYRAATGEVIAHRPGKDDEVIFHTPVGSTAGVIAIAADGTLYMTSHSDAPGIWHIRADGHGDKIAQLPPGAWPNGLDFGPDGKLYSPDSALGLIWRIDPATGQSEAAIEDKRLLARKFISLAPGANGLHFNGHDLYVTVSDRTNVLKYTLNPTGRFDEPVLVATGIPGDDFAIGHDGSLFITTHPYNTVVHVAPDGSRTIVGKEAQHIVGATDAVFGKTPNDKDTLYVVTDGGAFTGGPKTRGELIALKPYGEK